MPAAAPGASVAPQLYHFSTNILIFSFLSAILWTVADRGG
jgi:hypothetical protein